MPFFQEKKMVLTYVSLMFLMQACGSRRQEDLESANGEKSQDKSGQVKVNTPLSQDAVGVNPGSCSVDMKQAVILNPAEGVRAVFSGKVQASCKEGKRATLYVFSPVEFAVDPSYGCMLNDSKEFNIRCQGSAVRLAEDGSFQITISGDSKFDSTKVRMKISFENPS